MICCFKSTAVMFFNQQDVFKIHGRPIGLCLCDTGEKAHPVGLVNEMK